MTNDLNAVRAAQANPPTLRQEIIARAEEVYGYCPKEAEAVLCKALNNCYPPKAILHTPEYLEVLRLWVALDAQGKLVHETRDARAYAYA